MFVKGSTKRGQQLLASASWRNYGNKIYDVYGKPSSAKVNAWMACMREYAECLDRNNFRITSFNCQHFTVAWECTVEYVDPKTGEVTMERITHIDTGYNTYEVLLDK